MIIEKKFKKALLEKKISQQLNGKNVTEIKTSIFPSSKEIKEINLKESLKNTGVLSPETEEHLTVRKLPKISDEKYYEIQNNIIKNDELKELYDQLNNKEIDFKYSGCKGSVGGISPLTYLIETFFIQIKKRKKKWKKNIIY